MAYWKSTGTPGSRRHYCTYNLFGQLFSASHYYVSRCRGLIVYAKPGFQNSLDGGLSRSIQRGIPLLRPLVQSLLAGAENLGAGLAQLVGVFRSFGFGRGNRPVRFLHGSGGAGAAFFQGPAKRPLHQPLIGQNQNYEQDQCWQGGEHKIAELLNDFLHVGMERLLLRLSRVLRRNTLL